MPKPPDREMTAFTVETYGGQKEVQGFYVAGTDKVLAITESTKCGGLGWSITHANSGLTLGGIFTRTRAVIIAKEFWQGLSSKQKTVIRKGKQVNKVSWPIIQWYREQVEKYSKE